MKLKFKIVIFIQINTGISNFTRNQTTQNAFISIYYIQKFNNLVQCLNSKMKKKKKVHLLNYQIIYLILINWGKRMKVNKEEEGTANGRRWTN